MGLADPERELFPKMLGELRRHHPQICRAWFEHLECLGIAAGAVNIRADSATRRDYLQRDAAAAFADAAISASGRLLAVRFLGPGEFPPPDPKPDPKPDWRPDAGELPPGLSNTLIEPRPLITIEPAHGSPVNRYESLVVNPDYDFDHFVQGPNNRLAYAAARAVAAQPGRSYNPLYIHGGVGLGKTHLLQAICLQVLAENPAARLRYISCDSFVTQFFESVQRNDVASFRERFREVDMLVIDDIHFLTQRERSQEEFFHTFNTLFLASKQLVFSSDDIPDNIPQLHERLASRFKWGLVAKVEAPDFETRIQIVKSKARLRGIMLPDDAAAFIATRITTNIRELEGAVIKVHMLAAVDQRTPDLALVREALGEPNAVVLPGITIQQIIAVVVDHFAIRLSDLQSKRRQRSIALPRQVCMALARRHTPHSLEEIGGFFGGRDHTTVMHAVRTVDQRRSTDPDFDATLRDLEQRLLSRDA